LSTSTSNSPGDSSAATSSGDRWEARPVAAATLRAAIVLAPLAASSAALLGLSHLWRAPAGGRQLWLATLAVVAVVVAFGVERAARRLLPLASLLRLTMLFPDRAPSRLRIARAAGTTGQQLDRLARSEDDTAQVAAEKVLTLITALGNHDRKTRGHSERVRLYCDLLAEQLHVPKAERDRLRWGSLLHDIGKLEIAPTILNKPAKLSDREFARIREHPTVGAEIASPLLPWLGEWGGGIIDHHERWDGRGYPEGRAGAEISRAGRIVGVVDAFETMTAARVYKKAMTTRAARIELAACAGTQFDPAYVRAFLAISLPKVLWAMGPLAFVVQLPFLRSLAKLGSQATQISAQGASAAGVAAAAGVIGVAAPAVISGHGHFHPHSHTAAVASGHSGGGSSSQATGTNVSAGTNGGGSSRTDQAVTASRLTTFNGRPGVDQTQQQGAGSRNPASAQVGQPGGPGAPGTGTGSGTGSGSAPGSGTGPATPNPLSVVPTTVYAVAGQLRSIDVLSTNLDLLASTVAITSGPSGGSATVAAGNINYQAQSGFHGVDQVTFEACNAAGRCGSADLTVNVLGSGQSGADYSGVNLAGLDLTGFNFAGATLRGTDFTGANLSGVNFSGADLTGAALHGSQLAKANLNNANLSNADLSAAAVSGVIASGVDLSGANLSGVTGGAGPQVSALNLSTTIGSPITINVSSMVSDPNVPIDWSTLQITKSPAHGSVRITGPHTIVYTPAAGLLSVVQFGFSVDNVLSFGASGSQSIAVVL
jgi:uncharacterized protein YjbI with pentapeptide repeats